jgi:hypothetical protein
MLEERSRHSWTAEGSEFESRYRQDFSSLHVIQIYSGDHVVYLKGGGDVFPGVK